MEVDFFQCLAFYHGYSILKTQKKDKRLLRFVILTPHRDAASCIGVLREKLFVRGFLGAYSFPIAAPIAEVVGPLSLEQLGELSRNIRSLCRKGDGKIYSQENVISCGSQGLSFFGPSLDLQINEKAFPESSRQKILFAFPKPAICAALLNGNDSGGEILEEIPPIAFRSGYLSNLILQPIPGLDYSFRWTIGPAVWLPSRTAEKKQA